jgi:hypothetical protein
LFRYLNILILITTLFTHEVNAQDVLIFDANIGVAVPLGDISSANPHSIKNGFASTGGMIRTWIGLKPSKHVGLFFQMNGALLPTNTSLVEDRINQQFGINSSVNKSNTLFGATLGGVLLSGIVKEWSIDGRIAAGYTWVQSPQIELMYDNKTYYKLYMNNGEGFALSAGVGARKKIWKSFHASFALDFLYALPFYKNVFTESRSITNTMEVSMNSYHQSVFLLLLTGGFSFAF